MTPRTQTPQQLSRAAYKARQEAAGTRVASFRLSEYARAMIALYAAKNGLSKDAAVEAMVRGSGL